MPSSPRRPPQKLRKQYTNTQYPTLVLRFEDGHEIHIERGTGKSFDAWPGEVVKVIALWDPTSAERELVESRRAEEFEDAR